VSTGKVFITGVSSGIGEALADLYLRQGYEVYGTSRRAPYALLKRPGFHFRSFDLARLDRYDELFAHQLAALPDAGLDVVFLNAGVSGNVPLTGMEFALDELQHTLSVNVLANKLLLDRLLGAARRPTTVVVSASMAGVRFRAGTLTYSVSKAALAALAGVYAQEHPDVFFAVLGLCNVNTSLSRQMAFSERTTRFADLKALQGRALAEGYMISPAQRAQDVFEIVRAPSEYGLDSGVFQDIRQLLQRHASATA
jgi:NAD(P)-dependent dehydrogenase (short-subunit alcohol dehydrogenase family)